MAVMLVAIRVAARIASIRRLFILEKDNLILMSMYWRGQRKLASFVFVFNQNKVLVILEQAPKTYYRTELNGTKNLLYSMA